MTTVNGGGGLRFGALVMKGYDKKFFDTYSDAEIWLLNDSGGLTDGIIRKEAGRYFVFVNATEEQDSSQ